MATLLNDRNQLLFSASSRVTGASVSLSSGTATSIIFPKPASGTTTIVPVPTSVILTASTTGYISPSWTWSYRFGNTGNFTAIAQTTNPITFTTDTAFATAAGTKTTIEFKVAVAETTSNIGINQAEYVLSVPIIREGLDGVNGVSALNNTMLTIYRRTLTSTAPTFTAQDLAADSTYTFTTGQVVGQPTDWTQTIPTASVPGTYLWVSQVRVASVTSSYSFNNSLFSAPVLYAQDGIQGTKGINTAVIYAYQRSSSALTTNPGDIVYDFTTNAITTATLANNWQKTIPSGTDNLYVTAVTVSGTATTASAAAANWSTPALIGNNGFNNATVYLYARNNSTASAPPLATTGYCTYSFSNGQLSGTSPNVIPTNWYSAIPNDALGSTIWVVQATAVSVNATDQINNTEWSTARILTQQGGTGPAGTRGTRQVYLSSTSFVSNFTYLTNPSGYASYAARATVGLAAAVAGTTPTTPIKGDTVVFSNGSTSLFTASITGTTLIVTGVTLGSLVVGQVITGSGIASGTTITALISGTGATGTYVVNNSQTVSSTTITGLLPGTYIYTLTYNSDTSRWEPPGTVIDGNLLVTGSVTAAKINSNGLSIKDTNGKIILQAGTPLDWSVVPTGLAGGSNLVSNGSFQLNSSTNFTSNYGPKITTTAASSSNGTANISFAIQGITTLTPQGVAPFMVGETIIVEGITPTPLNGYFTVLACTASSVTFLLAETYGPQTVAGTVQGTRYINTDGKNAYGSIYTLGPKEFFNDEYISVDSSITYRAKVSAKSTGTGGLSAAYLMIACYDKDRNFINHWQNAHYQNTETTLAVNLVKGATTITVTNAANWASMLASPSLRYAGITVEGYKNYTYAKTSLQYTSILNNIITLASEYSGPTIAAGTAIANYYAGSTYNYTMLSNGLVPNTWTEYTGYMYPVPSETYPVSESIFRHGTAFVRIGALANYGQNNLYKLVFDDWSLEQAPDLLSTTLSVNAVTGAGFRAGNLTWDASGNRISGQGVAMTPGGILGHNGVNTTFSLNSSTGNATFAGLAQSNDGKFVIDFANKFISITI